MMSRRRSRCPGRERVIVRLINMTGMTPATTMVSAPSAHSSSSSSDAYWYTKVARVSKLTGAESGVNGSSFIVSTNTSNAAVMTLGRMIGACTRTSARAGLAPNVRATPSTLGVTRDSPESTVR